MHDSPVTRPSLLVRIRDAKDHQAWTDFVRLYSPLVYGYARRRGLQDADAADIAQEVLQTVTRSINHFDYDRRHGSFRAWLLVVTRSRVCDLLASRARQVQGSGDTGVLRFLEKECPAEDDQTCWERDYQKCMFDWAVEKVRGHFRDSTWQAFWQTSVDGKDTQQVAESLEMTVRAVYLARSRVLARLKETIRQAED